MGLCLVAFSVYVGLGVGVLGIIVLVLVLNSETDP